MQYPKVLLIISVSFLSALFCHAQEIAKLSNVQLKEQLTAGHADTNQVKILRELGTRSLDLPGENKADLDTAYGFFNKAEILATQLKQPDFVNKVRLSLAQYLVESGNLAKGDSLMKLVIDYDLQKGDKRAAAEAWTKLGDLYMNNGKMDHPADRIQAYDQAIDLYRQLGDQSKMLLQYGLQGMVYFQTKQFKDAEKVFLIMRDGSKGKMPLQDLYMHALDWLTVIGYWQSDYYKELSYALENFDNMQKHPELYPLERQDAGLNHLARIYERIGNFDKSEYYGKQELALVLKLKGNYKFGLSTLTESLLKQNKAKEALKVIRETIETAPPNPVQKVTVFHLLGKAYENLGNHKLAEINYLDALKALNALEPGQREPVSILNINLALASLSAVRRDFGKAEIYINELKQPGLPITAINRRDIAELQSKVDSSKGNYAAALRAYQLHKRLSDSILNVTKIDQINKLEISFDTRQKQNRIDLLDAQGKVKEQELEKAHRERDMTIAGIGVMILISSLTFYGFRIKTRNNRLLQIKQNKINQQNESLHVLLNEKEGLLTDKDMLLKEVHHRVKNNLQIVMSILASQSSQLKNKQAAEVMEESHHRVQAIALIHEKLYMDSGGAHIPMQSYISDLILDLAEGLGIADRNIQFEQRVEHITLDIDQAVPVGLILNEAITNAIKHAFPDGPGLITIILARTGNERITLSIADNGKGLPENFDLKHTTSLGLKLIKGLCRQLKGVLEIVNESGVKLVVEFSSNRIPADQSLPVAQD